MKLTDNKSVFNISIDEQKYVTLIAEGNQANLFFSGFRQNDKIKNLDEIYCLVGNLIQIHNFENEIKINQVQIVPFIEGLTKNGSSIFNQKNKIPEIIDLNNCKTNEKDFFDIQEQISTKYLNEVISHQIDKDGDLYFHATRNNLIIDKFINRLYFYYKEHFTLLINTQQLLDTIKDILKQNYNKSTCTSYFNIQNFSDILIRNNILKQLSIDEKLEFENKVNDFIIFKDNNHDINKFINLKEII